MFEEFLSNQESWLNGKGPSSEIVFSSRLRLARNLMNFVFPSKASLNQKEAILQKIEASYTQVRLLKKALCVRMEELSDLDKEFLLERHLISQEHLGSIKGKGLIISSNERIAIMINEEDHLRIQVLTSGFDLKNSWRILNELDTELSKVFPFAFSPTLGYLTSCPTNVGTGLRASCMLHLPALVLTKRINKILELLAKISFTARGLFGEGTQALGNFFQISNQSTLGHSEEELIDNLTGVVSQIKHQELDARNNLLKKYRLSIEDNIWRAYANLSYARLMSSKEAFAHLSMLSLGLDLGIIKGIKRELLHSLFIIIQPAHLQKIENKALKEGERDYIRAEVLRRRLNIKEKED